MAIPEPQTCDHPIVQNYQRTLKEVRETTQEQFEKFDAHIAVRRLAQAGKNGNGKAHAPSTSVDEPCTRAPSDPFEA